MIPIKRLLKPSTIEVLLKLLEYILLGLFVWEISFMISGNHIKYDPAIISIIFTIAQLGIILIQVLVKTKQETTDEHIDNLIDQFNKQKKKS